MRPAIVAALATGARFSPPQRFYKDGGRRVDLTPEQYSRLSELSGRYTRQSIESLMQQPGWSGLLAETRATAIRKAADTAKKRAKAELLGNAVPPASSPLIKRGAGMATQGKAGPPPPPPGFSLDGEAGGLNVYRDLQEAIPGVRFTSGYRSAEYQADMRRRGYTPASNSGHLDGSALDLLPPPGKTIAWLVERVRREQPNARLLNEGDHLHATFPGYYGAPVLGGATRAGLKNPLAGMPPPPPGFVLD